MIRCGRSVKLAEFCERSRAGARGFAGTRLDGKRSSSGRLIWRSRDLPRQETASAGNALLQWTGKAAVLSAQAEGAPRASAGRARPSARSGSIDWFLAWRPPWHLGPQAQPGAEPVKPKLANPETCVSHFTHRGRFICRDAGPPDRSHLRPGRNHLRRGNRIAGVIERCDLEKCSPSREGPRVRNPAPSGGEFRANLTFRGAGLNRHPRIWHGQAAPGAGSMPHFEAE